MSLTNTAINKAKPTDKPQRLFDGGGMYLEISPAGGKLWRLKYRYAGKEKRLALGIYPDVTLAEARERREEARKILANGADPGQVKAAQKLAGRVAAADSFEAIAQEWATKHLSTLTPGHQAKVMRQLEKDLFPWLGNRPITELTAPELLQALRRVEGRGAVHTAKRLLQYSGQIFRYGVATGRCERDPSGDLRGALARESAEHRAAITEPAAVGELLRAIDGFRGTFIVQCALRLAPMLFVRPGELRKAEWTEFDLDRAEWNIPAGKMKMRTAHLVALSQQAVAILRELHALTGTGLHVFPGARSNGMPMSNAALNAALRRMGYDTRTEITGHGFRAMARTILDEVLGFRPDFIEHQLAHAVKDPNGRAYNRTAHLAERRKMMQAWADYLDKLKAGAEVIPLHGGAA